MRKDIYNRDAWKIILEKYPKVKRLATELGLQNSPGKIRTMRKDFKGPKKGTYSKEEKELLMFLAGVEFGEQGMLRLTKEGCDEAKNVGDEERAYFLSLLGDINLKSSFDDFLKVCKRRKLSVDSLSFQDAYKIFLEVIVLKMNYKIPLTKYFIVKLLEMRGDKESYSIEIKNYFIEHNDPAMLAEINNNLLLGYSPNV